MFSFTLETWHMAVGVYLVILEMLKLRKNFPYGFIQLGKTSHTVSFNWNLMTTYILFLL